MKAPFDRPAGDCLESKALQADPRDPPKAAQDSQRGAPQASGRSSERLKSLSRCFTRPKKKASVRASIESANRFDSLKSN
jgi:hypothetical protein